jgi:hypothetical protein
MRIETGLTIMSFASAPREKESGGVIGIYRILEQ